MRKLDSIFCVFTTIVVGHVLSLLVSIPIISQGKLSSRAPLVGRVMFRACIFSA